MDTALAVLDILCLIYWSCLFVSHIKGKNLGRVTYGCAIFLTMVLFFFDGIDLLVK